MLEGLDLPLDTFQLQDEGINVIPMRSKTLQSTASSLHVQGHRGLGAACLRLGRGWTRPCWLWQMMAIAADLRVWWREICITANAAVEELFQVRHTLCQVRKVALRMQESQ